MAYTSPSTLTTGTLITASIWNTSITDNWAASWVGTNAGDMDYYTAATTKSKLSIGTAGYGLLSTGTAPVWSPGIKVLHHDTSGTTVETSDYATSDAVAFSYTLTGGELGTNGVIKICGSISITGSPGEPLMYLSYGTTSSSDGVVVLFTSDTGSAAGEFSVSLIARGATAERMIGSYMGSNNTLSNGASYWQNVNAISLTIDQSVDKSLNFITGSGWGTGTSGSMTLEELLIYRIPYYTT